MEKEPDNKIDYDFFEYIIAYNATKNDIYTAAIIDVFDIEYLKSQDIQKYLKIIIDFFKKHGKTPNATEIRSYLVNDEMKSAYKNVITKFSQMDSEYNLDELLKNTEKYLQTKAVYAAVLDTVNKYSKENAVIEPDATLEKFTKACNITLVENLGFDYFNRIDDHILDLTTQEKYISTGFTWMDRELGGGFLERGRALYIFSGPTNSGKSIVLGNVVTNILKQGKTVALISLEMPEYVYAKRISSQLSKIPMRGLKNESEQLRSFLNNYQNKHPGARLFIKEYPPHNITPASINTYLQRLALKERVKFDAIVLDYLNLIEAMNPSGSSFTDGKKVAEHTRSLSYMFECPVISAVQSNREAYDKVNPGIQTTGESIGIPQTADAQISIWSSDTEKELGIIHMGFQKNRFGRNFDKCQFKIDYDTLSIDENEAVFSNNTDMKDMDKTLTGLAALDVQ